MAKVKADANDNIKDLEHRAFRIDTLDPKDVQKAVCDEIAHSKLDEIILELGGTGSRNIINQYDEINSIVKLVETTIGTFTATEAVTYIQSVHVSGENIAEYKLKVNGTVIDKKRTYFGSELNGAFQFNGISNAGYEITTGDVVTITVLHNRPQAADFNSRLQILEDV